MRPPTVTVSLGLVGLLAACPATLARAQPVPEGPRRIVVLSDLHMGEGRDSAGEWFPNEDFRWADDLDLFLGALASETDEPTDLILNGDTFDLAQMSVTPCAHEEPYLGCTEAEALARLERVLDAHARELRALGAFAGAGDNRVVLVPGDHDAALLFPEAGIRAVAAFGAAAGRVTLAAQGFWRSVDGLVHVEHGHQIGIGADRFEAWPAPFVEHAGRRHIEQSADRKMLLTLFDRYETRFPVVDNLADDTAGLRFALAATGADDVGAAAPVLLRELLFRFSWQQFRMDLDSGDVQPPEWRIDQVRAEGAAFLVGSVPDDDRLQPLVAQAFAAGQLDALMTALSDDELRALCDQRAAVRRARRRFERILTQIDPLGPPVAECPRTEETTGPRFEYFWQSRDRLFQRQLERRRGEGAPIAVFIHGHTHLADFRQDNFTRVEAGGRYVVDGFSPVRDAVTPIVINGGAWQRTVTPVMLDRFRNDRGSSDIELLEALQPEQLPPCYSFVEVDAYTARPDPPQLRYWREGEGGGWAMARGCGRRITG